MPTVTFDLGLKRQIRNMDGLSEAAEHPQLDN